MKTKKEQLLELLAPYRDKTLSRGCEVEVTWIDGRKQTALYLEANTLTLSESLDKTELRTNGDDCGSCTFKKNEVEILGHHPTLDTLLLCAKDKGVSLNISQLGEVFQIVNGERVYGNIIDLTQTLDQYSEEVSGALVELLSK